VEELMRYLSIAHVSPVRAATVDVELGGVCVRAGDGVILPLLAANWDDEAFPGAGRFDIHRAGAHRHIGFGYGIHQCIGQTLARLELHAALRRLTERVPTLRLAVPVEELPFKYDALFYGVHELPVCW
jgi:cytochrome P450